MVEVPRVELTVQEKSIIAAKRTEIKRKRELERERGQDAKTQNDANGWPMPETKTKIAEMTKAERMKKKRIINKQTFEGISLSLIALQHKALARALVFGEKHRLLSPRSHSHRESIRLD